MCKLFLTEFVKSVKWKPIKLKKKLELFEYKVLLILLRCQNKYANNFGKRYKEDHS
jgi:hypothetical protein